MALRDVSRSQRQLLLQLHVDAETSFTHRCLLPMMLNCSHVAGGAGLAAQNLAWGSSWGSAPPPSPPLSLVEPATASPTAPRVRAHCCEAPRAPGDLVREWSRSSGVWAGLEVPGEAAQGVSCAGWDHQVLLRMAGPAKAMHRGSLFCPGAKGGGIYPS